MNKLLIIVSLSAVAALLFFLVGGSLAEVSNKDGTALGFTFQAGGPFAAFLIVFWMAQRAFKNLEAEAPAKPIDVTVRVRALRKRPFKWSEDYTAKCEIKPRIGESREERVKPGWQEGGWLSLDLEEINTDDKISLTIHNGQRMRWEVDQFQISEAWRDAYWRDNRATTEVQALEDSTGGQTPLATKPRRSTRERNPRLGAAQPKVEASGSPKPAETIPGGRTGLAAPRRPRRRTPKASQFGAPDRSAERA